MTFLLVYVYIFIDMMVLDQLKILVLVRTFLFFKHFFFLFRLISEYFQNRPRSLNVSGGVPQPELKVMTISFLFVCSILNDFLV